MVDTLEINSTQVRQLLKSWEYPAKLGSHPLAQLICVKRKFAESGQSETVIRRGQVVKEILNQCIQTLRPAEGEPEPLEKEWRTYLIITERYCFGRLPEWIMVNLSISSRSFYRELKDGVDQIAVYLSHLEDEAKRSPKKSKERSTNTQVVKLFPPALPDQPVIGRSPLVTKVSDLFTKQKINKIALFGLPGVGKTTATLEILSNKIINDHFSDGVVWFGLGPKVDIEQQLFRLALLAEINDSQIINLEKHELRLRIRENLSDKKMLFVFDDVWQMADVQYLCLQSNGSAVLCTTRQPSLAIDFAQPVGAISVSELDLHQSKLLLNEIAPNLFEEEEKFETLHQLAGGLPLALTIFGRYLRRQGYQGQKNRLQYAFEKLKERDARQSISIQAEQFNLQSLSERSLGNVIGLSCDTLSPSARQLFHSLSIIPPKPNSFDVDTALSLSDHSADPLYELIDSGLVESVGEDRYTLHQAIFDVACSIEPQKETAVRFVNAMVLFLEKEKNNFTIIESNRVNIETALELCYQAGLIEEASKLSVGLGLYLLDRGQVDAAQNHADQLSHAFTLGSFSEIIENGIQARLEYLVGNIANRQNQFEEAIQALDKASDFAQQAALPDIQLGGQFIVLSIYVKWADREEIKRVVNNVEAQISQSTNDFLIGEAHVNLSNAYYKLQEVDATYDHIQKAKPLYEKHNRNMGLIWKTLGLTYVERADYSNAIIHYEKALVEFQAQGMQIDMAHVLNNIAVVAMYKSQWTKALKLSKEVYEMRQELDDINGCMISLINLSYITLALKDGASAAEYIDSGLALVREKGVRHREASFLINKSALVEMQGDYELACQYGKEAFDIAEEANLNISKALATAKIGIAYLAQSSFDEAEHWLQMTYDICDEASLPHMFAHANKLLSELYFHKNDLGKAQHHIEAALPYFDRTTDGVTDPIEALQTCARILKKIGDEKRAADYTRKANLLLKQQSQEIKDSALKKAFLEHFKAYA